MNKHKQFIKDAYNGKYGSMCRDWKETILEHYPEFKEEKFKVGEWYIGGSYLFYLSKIDESRMSFKYTGYGFTCGEYKEVMRFNKGGVCFESKATKEEVETALIAEAKKRGFKKGVYIKTHDGVFGKITSGYNHQYNILTDLFYFHNMLIFNKGKWAEIKTTMTKAEAEKELNSKIV